MKRQSRGVQTQAVVGGQWSVVGNPGCSFLFRTDHRPLTTDHCPIEVVAEDRVADVGAVDAQLIGAPGDWLQLDESGGVQTPYDAEAGFGRLAICEHPA